MKALRQYLEEQRLYRSGIENMFAVFYDLLTKANETVNLTAVIEKSEAEQKHFIDSLSAAPYIYGTVLDIGAGAGFPGIPLAIVKPELSFILADSVGKKVDFLNTVIKELGLKNATAVKSRIEDLPKSQKCDCVLARGVGALNVICEYALPFLKTGGLFIAYKAQKAPEELQAAENALNVLGGELEAVHPYTLTVNGEPHGRSLILIRKTKETDKKYPRGQNKPRIRPL